MSFVGVGVGVGVVGCAGVVDGGALVWSSSGRVRVGVEGVGEGVGVGVGV